jgi:hypothetical protein
MRQAIVEIEYKLLGLYSAQNILLQCGAASQERRMVIIPLHSLQKFMLYVEAFIRCSHPSFVWRHWTWRDDAAHESARGGGH